MIKRLKNSISVNLLALLYYLPALLSLWLFLTELFEVDKDFGTFTGILGFLYEFYYLPLFLLFLISLAIEALIGFLLHFAKLNLSLEKWTNNKFHKYFLIGAFTLPTIITILIILTVLKIINP